jgi:hypothetical protein
VAFNLTVEPVSERREVSGVFEDGRDNFGYVVTYRAKAPNGRAIAGDGACFAVEKARRFKCPHPHPRGWKNKSEHWPAETCPDFDPAFQWRTLPAQATEHNIRSHAHTRAFNRAVSNLVGFGEVSAEEVERGEVQPEDFVVGDVPPGPGSEPVPVPRIALPEGTFQIVAVRSFSRGNGEVAAVGGDGKELMLSVAEPQMVKLCEQVLQERVPVTLDKVKSQRSETVKLKGITRYREQPAEPQEAKLKLPITSDQIPF